jgi:hypothetical protein
VGTPRLGASRLCRTQIASGVDEPRSIKYDMAMVWPLLQIAVTLVAQVALTVHVRVIPTRSSSPKCLFVIRNPIVEGGTQTTCLRTVEGVPYAGAIVRSSGTMTFALRRGVLRAKVTSTLSFGRDGTHASQQVAGTLTGGSGAYEGARGTVTASGSVVDRASGLGPVAVTYRFAIRN